MIEVDMCCKQDMGEKLQNHITLGLVDNSNGKIGSSFDQGSHKSTGSSGVAQYQTVYVGFVLTSLVSVTIMSGVSDFCMLHQLGFYGIKFDLFQQHQMFQNYPVPEQRAE